MIESNIKDRFIAQSYAECSDIDLRAIRCWYKMEDHMRKGYFTTKKGDRVIPGYWVTPYGYRTCLGTEDDSV